MEQSVLDYVVSRNLHRRHLNESQRAAIAAKLANMTRGGMRDPERANLPFRENEISNEEAAEKLNVSTRSVKAARKVQREAVPEVVEKVEAGELAVSTAAEIADLFMPGNI